jgi:hypothetical protein
MIKRNSIQSGEYRNLDQLIDALTALPPAPYIANAARDFDPSQGFEINMGCAGITRADSARPILGTMGLASCMGVVIFNPEQKTGGIAHLSQAEDDHVHLSKDSEKALKSLLAAARGDSGDRKLEVRISGPVQSGELGDIFIKDVLRVLNETPNLTFLSADFRGKDYPTAVGIDTRRWDEGLLKGKSTAVSSPRDDLREVARRIVEGARGAVDIDSLPAAPGYNAGRLFDARALAKYSDRDKPAGNIER